MSQTPVYSKAAVAAPHDLASESGRAVLSEGGNALEAMVAMAATIAVVYPHMNAIGGDGFWVIHEPGGTMRAIEACGFAAGNATIARYREKGMTRSRRAAPMQRSPCPVPLAAGRRRWNWPRPMAAKFRSIVCWAILIRFARDGYTVSASEGREEAKEIALIKKAPGFLDTYYFNNERPKGGETRKVPALANTLEHLAREGLEQFYRGDIAREIGADAEKIGSPLTRADMEKYNAVWRDPLALKLKDVTLYNFRRQRRDWHP